MPWNQPEPEPLEWRAKEALRQRVWRAVSVPAAAGIVIFIAAVLVAVVFVWVQPHDVSDLDSAQDAGTTGLSNRAADLEQSSRGTTRNAAPSHATAVAKAEVVFIHVVGEVKRPGVVELPAGARVEAALTAAGGATEAAELSVVNLARVVVDGEQIRIPDAESAATAGLAFGSGGAGSSSPGGTAMAGPLNLNTADAVALEALPGVGPALAQRIIAWRETHGRFQSVEQLLEVSGIGSKTLDGFRNLLVAQ